MVGFAQTRQILHFAAVPWLARLGEGGIKKVAGRFAPDNRLPGAKRKRDFSSRFLRWSASWLDPNHDLAALE